MCNWYNSMEVYYSMEACVASKYRNIKISKCSCMDEDFWTFDIEGFRSTVEYVICDTW